MKLYHMAGSRSTRVIWVLEELGLPYELFTKEREELKKPDFMAVNSLAKVPVLLDGDIKLLESGAMVEYLVRRYGKGRLAPDAKDASYPQYLQWFQFSECTLMPVISRYILAAGTFYNTPPDEQGMAAAMGELKPIAELVENALSSNPYITGDVLTAADIMISWNLFIGLRFEVLNEYSNIVSYIERLAELPNYKKSMEGRP